ncbi:histidine kinase [Aquimarina sp. SS2-1]|uniref:tetratricopeptide repeat-containing sensor histidine kinase n=1 Tax=Aquimarina besae TaxID=3342247 RepID=UPI0036707716
MRRFLDIIILSLIFSLSTTIIGQNQDIKTSKLEYLKELEKKENKLSNEVRKSLSSNKESEAYQQAQKYLKNFKTDLGKASISNLLIYYYNVKSVPDSSIFYANKVLSLKNFSNDTVRYKYYIEAYTALSYNYGVKGLYEKSKKNQFKGIEIAQKIQDTSRYYKQLLGLGISYSREGNDAEALKLFNEILTYKKVPILTQKTYSNIGVVYRNSKNYKASIANYKKALELCHPKDYYSQIINTMNIGSGYIDLGDYDKGIEFIRESIKIGSEKEYIQIKTEALGKIGSALVLQKKYDEAKNIFDSCLIKTAQYGWIEERLNIYNKLRELAILQNNYTEAYKYQTEHYKIKDSLDKLQKDKEINQLEVKFRTLQKEKEIKVLQNQNTIKSLALKSQGEALENIRLQTKITEQENQNRILSLLNESEKQKNESAKRKNEITILKKDQKIQELEINRQKSAKQIILIAFLIILIPIIGLLILYYQKLKTQNLLNIKQKEISEQKIATLISDQELKMIKASVKGQDKERKRIAQELHDSIGGNLAAIKLQFSNLSENYTELDTMYQQIDETYQQVRTLSHNLIPKKFSQNKFVALLKEYMQNIGDASNLTINIQAYPENEVNIINPKFHNEIFAILQELITNTIKHAKASIVDIQIDITQHTIHLIFEDNGKGFDTSKNVTGIGLSNIKNRLQNLQGTFVIDSNLKRKGTIFIMEIPNVPVSNETDVLEI